MPRPTPPAAAALGLVLAVAHPAPLALASGSGENALLIINPSNPESLYIGNYYKHARDIPDANVLYIDPGAPDYAQFAAANLDALFGTLANHAIADHIDYIVIAPGGPVAVIASGYVTDGCAPVNRFSVSSAYATAFLKDEILAGSVPSSRSNQYYTNSDTVAYFDSSFAYLNGSINSQLAARRYFIGAMLGYTGQRGNTLPQILSMIDRSVAADGDRPVGASYYMKTTDFPRSSPRDPRYPAAVTSIINLGGAAEQIIEAPPDNLRLPLGRHDCLGVMTGSAVLDILNADMTLLPGSFCDHLTSFAATFEDGSQTKLSDWIAKGASGSSGAVEEPCNYPGKFPHARFHVFYRQGLSLGESFLRSHAFVPFQGLLYGDPLTRPFAHIPSVTVTNPPPNPVSGSITITPTAASTNPNTSISRLEVYVDGVLQGLTGGMGSVTVDTTTLPDGHHDLRVLAYESGPVRSIGRWVSTLVTSNHARSTSLSAQQTTGDLNTRFLFDVAAVGPGVGSIRLLQGGRVVATSPGDGTIVVFGKTLGAGPVRLRAETRYADGRTSLSAPVELTIAYAESVPSNLLPVAFGYTKVLEPDSPAAVELPATFDQDQATAVYTIVTPPSLFTIVPGPTGAYRVMRPPAGPWTSDEFTFRITTSRGESNTGTVRLRNAAAAVCAVDINADGTVTVADFLAFLGLYSDGDARADFTGDGAVNVADFLAFLGAYSAGC